MTSSQIEIKYRMALCAPLEERIEPDELGVIGLQYCPKSLHDCPKKKQSSLSWICRELCWRVWWEIDPDHPSWLPKKALVGISPIYIDMAVRAPFKRIKLTGRLPSYLRLDRQCDSTATPTTMHCWVESRIKNQASGVDYALNSVLNASDILGKVILFDAIEQAKLNPMRPLQEIVHMFTAFLDFVRVKQINQPLLQILNEKDSGVFVIESVGHAFCWDASKRLLFESDPCFPTPVLCCQLKDFGIKRVDRAYQVLLKALSKKRKRNK